MWASLAAATTAVTTAVTEQAAAAGAAAQSAVAQIAEGFEQEGLAMRQKEAADAQALQHALDQAKRQQAQEALAEKERGVGLQLPWVVDGVPDEVLRASIFKLSESVHAFLEPLPTEMNSRADFADGANTNTENTDGGGGDGEFDAAGKVEVNKKLLEIDPALASQRTKLVRRRTTSSTVTEDVFWRRYWFHVGVAQESHRLRQSLSHLANKRNSSGGTIVGTEDRALGNKLDMELDSDPEDDIVEFVSASQLQPLGRSDEGRPSEPTRENGSSQEESGDDLDNFNSKAAEEEEDEEAVATRAPPETVVLTAPALPDSPDVASDGADGLEEDGEDLLGEFEDLGDALDDLKLSGEDAGFNDLGDLEDLDAEVEDLLAVDDF